MVQYAVETTVHETCGRPPIGSCETTISYLDVGSKGDRRIFVECERQWRPKPPMITGWAGKEGRTMLEPPVRKHNAQVSFLNPTRVNGHLGSWDSWRRMGRLQRASLFPWRLGRTRLAFPTPNHGSWFQNRWGSDGSPTRREPWRVGLTTKRSWPPP